MPWQEQDVESLRREFALRAGQPKVNMRVLCREYGISAKTSYREWQGCAAPVRFLCRLSPVPRMNTRW